MKNNKQFSIRDRLRSFRFAFRGMKTLIAEEHNARVHLLATGIVILLGVYRQIAAQDWIWISLAIILVFICELLNTAIENICDGVDTSHQPWIQRAKDTAAAAVLLAALFAIGVGVFVFVL